jgi:1-deoxy-D-xylulose-5-phosphate synthase
MAAMDEPSLKASLAFMAEYGEGISSVRYPRDNVSARFTQVACPPFELGRARPLITPDHPDVAVLAFGISVIDAATAIDSLGDEVSAALYDARFAKPVDDQLLRTLLEARIPVVTVEDHSIRGGFGSNVLDACNRLGLDTRLVTRLALPDGWIYQGERKEQMIEAGIDPATIARTLRTVAAAPVERTPSAKTAANPS